jgi:MFS family permease
MGAHSLTFAYAIPIVVFEPYRRWAVFQTSMASTTADSIAAAAFIAVTGAAASPFYPLYYLIIAAVAMRFELRQALVAALLYVTTYTVVYLWTPDTTTHAMGLLSLRVSYMMIIALGVGSCRKRRSAPCKFRNSNGLLRRT